MHRFTAFGSAGLLAAHLAVGFAQNSTVECAKGLKMFVSRGTDEDMGFGVTGALVNAIAQQIEGSDSVYIAYPATDGNPSYFDSAANGTGLIKEAVTEYAQACPNSKMALFGYSQGGQITTNAMCGQPPVWATYGGVGGGDLEKIIEFSKPLPTNATKNVVSVVVFGDTTHRDDAPYNHGNSTGQGIFWRADISSCEALGDRIRSYCSAGDPFCDVGDLVIPRTHLTYIQDYGVEVAAYVVEQFESGDDAVESSSESTPTPVPENFATGMMPKPVLAMAVCLLTAMVM
ncbi:cutinase-domain-containing protein [Dactylonectria macrodidyma]|uniref:Cutinase-domain-containing protein n=1 Tax=Dactylonectria macrodidyma TaxID=307937 RepID=A0A9P9JK44_9HYPO|nr:cutinase-domain-containing protein [Dactylonectria macrodidyma]